MTDALSEEHQLQVQGYLRFAKMKRDQHMKEVSAVLSDFAEYRVRDSEVYTTKEVKELIADLREDVVQRVDTELENSSFASGLLLQMLFQQAEMADLYMEADTNELENESLLKQIAVSAEEAMSKPASAFAKKPQRLTKLGMGQVSDARIARERDSLKQQVQELQEKLGQATLQASGSASAGEEAKALQEKLAATQKQLDAEKAKVMQMLQKQAMSTGALSGEMTKEIEQLKLEFTLEAEEKDKMHAEALSELKKKNKKLRADVEKLQDESRVARLEASEAAGAADARMSESKQFQQMRKIMQQKSEEVTALRRRLAKYEPESVPDGDV